MANVKVTIERDQCTSCETCWTVCPEVFEQNGGDSWSQVVAKYQAGGDPSVGQFPDTLRDKVQEAADSCPVGIIHVG
jgi:ferredoxin